MRKLLSVLLCLALCLSLLPVYASAAGDAWDGTVDISWYDPDQSEYYISTPAQLAGLAALTNGMADPACPAIIGDASYLESIPVGDFTLVGAGGGNVSDTVYTSSIDFAYKTVYDGEITPSDELEGGRFWTVEEIKENLGKGVFTPNFENELNRLQLIK